MTDEMDIATRESFAIAFYSGHFRLSISQEVATELGAVIYGFSDLEFTLDLAITSLLGDEPHGARFLVAQMATAQLGFTQKCDLFASLYVFRAEASAKRSELKALLTALGDAANKRNDLLHARFFNANENFDISQIVRFKLKPKSTFGLQVKGQPLTVEMVKETVEQIAKATHLLIEFWSDEEKRLGYSGAVI